MGGAGVGATAFVGGSILLPIINSDGALVGGLGGTFINATPRPSKGGSASDYIN